MAAELKPYPAYRVSGVEALGKVPAQWEVRRLRTIAEMRVSNVDKHSRDGEWPVRLCNYVDVYKADRIQTGMPLMPATATSEEIERFRLLPGDVLITKDSEAWNDIGVPALVEGATDDTVCGYHLALLRPLSRCVSGGFLFRAVQSSAVAYQFHVRANGVTRYGLTHNGIKSTWLPVPPLAEQTAIVRFLDHVYRRIQRYIHAKEKLIALLEEQRQIVVHEAVTGRIDVRTGRPYPAYKDSGVEWLGSVPEHWEVRRVKSLSLVKRGASPRPIADSKYFDDYGEYAWVRIADVTASGRYLERTTQRLSALGQSLSVPLEPGALFLSIAGSVGKPTIARIKCCIHDGFVYFPQFNGLVEFLYRVFACGAPFARLGKLGTQLNLNTDTVGNISVGWPSVEEQTIIVEYLNRATGDTDSVIDRARLQIERLREYRSCLIADAVTGKLDVREAAARLPEVDPLSAESDLVDGVDHDAGSAWTDRRPTEEAGAPVGAGQ